MHWVATCSTIGQMRKPDQRRVHVNAASRASELRKFAAIYRFAANAEFNDMWVVVDIGSPQEEARVAEEIRTALGRRYGPFRDATVERHC